MDAISADFLRNLPLFAGLSEADLQWLRAQAETIEFRAGEALIEEGAAGDAMFIVQEGEFQVTKRSGAAEVLIDMRHPGDVIGEMSLLDRAPRSATVRALGPGRAFKIGQAAFEQLLAVSSLTAATMLRTVSARLKQSEALMRQREKMAGLGTLAAGLAHELNNPAAAARSSVSQLGAQMEEWESLAGQLNGLALSPAQTARLAEMRQDMHDRIARPPLLDPLARSDREDSLQTMLEQRGVEQAWQVAPALTGFGWDAAGLESVAEAFSREQFALVARWLSAGTQMHALLDELHTSVQRISEIIRAVKEYAYLDQAPMQEIDLHAGLENTLVILRHKLKDGITVARDYAPDLPRLEAYGSELNQVWTNIIDNAVQAMGGRGELRLRTRYEAGCIQVEIEDTGPGIPAEIQPRIFDPFFTTKPPGQGAGLGLNIAYGIVQKHQGDLRVRSQPGQTVFHVTLPLHLRRGAG